ncbi:MULTISPECIES: HNH endonuclease signature motif containing protein [unclassified Dyella]|uniref:HNH endonuclease n=1 Tax=Dyella sp. ASV21 TaxID=2795114 RepID=UPI0018EE3152|nr:MULTISPECIES: HNH endonuclease signature motif containing protein [unclassified Dyella]
MVKRVPVTRYAMEPKSMGSAGMWQFQLYIVAPGDPEALSVSLLDDLLRLTSCRTCGRTASSLDGHAQCLSQEGVHALQMPWSVHLAMSRRMWKENVRIRQKKRAIAERAASDPFTAAHVRPLLEAQGGLCYYCGDPLATPGISALVHRDHMTPLVKGGTHDVDNIVLACRTCNLDKNGFETAPVFCRRVARRLAADQLERARTIRAAVRRWKATRAKERSRSSRRP